MVHESISALTPSVPSPDRATLLSLGLWGSQDWGVLEPTKSRQLNSRLCVCVPLAGQTSAAAPLGTFRRDVCDAQPEEMSGGKK